jgi:parvulin-like peptidyl-prolyl cis-trans isomerase-like protein
LKKFYDAHLEDFVKPERARVFRISLPAKDAKEKAAARGHAAALLKDIDAREKKGEANAFQATAIKESKDAGSAPLGGDLRFSARDDLAKQYGAELADAAFALKTPGEKSGVVETSTGIELLKLQVKTAAMSRSFDESKDSIRSRMGRERRSREYDEWLKKLRDESKVTINDEELAKIVVEAPMPAGAGMPSASPMSSIGGAHQLIPTQMKSAAPPVAPAQRPAPSTAAAKIGGQ